MKITGRWAILMLLAALVALVVPAHATITLTDGNSSLLINPDDQSGVYNWTVGGNNVLYQQWFWYRVGDTAEQSIDTLGAPVVGTLGTRSAELLYTGSSFTIDILYSLTGGTTNLASDVAETIRIINTGSSSLDFHFFQYSDFDLNGIGSPDSVTLGPSVAGYGARQVSDNGGPVLSETVTTPAPSHVEANVFANTLISLDDGGPTTLNDVTAAGPGDVTWAFEWDRSIAAGDSLIISKDKNISPVPEPATILGLGTLLLFVGRKLSKRLA